MLCPNCGTSLPEGTQFCIECGAKIPVNSAPVNEGSNAASPAATGGAVSCPNCGNPVTGNEKFCIVCGAPLQSAQPVQPQAWAQPQAQPVQPQAWAQPQAQPVQPQAWAQPQAQPVMPPQEQPGQIPTPGYAVPPVQFQQNIGGAVPATLKEYVQTYADPTTQKTMKTYVIFIYVLAALNVFFALSAGSLPLDAIILAVIAFWYQKTYSGAAALTLLAYSILSVVLSLVMYGEFNGWLILILGISTAVTTLKVQKEYNALKNGG